MRILIALGFMLVATSSLGCTWVVNQEGGGDFTLVREALLAAGSGDSVLIYPGVYDEYDGLDVFEIRLTQGPLTIRGAGSRPEETALRISMVFDHIDAMVENLRIFNEGSPLLFGAGELVVRNCTFDNNESIVSGGGAIRGYGSLIVEDCTFYNNKSADPNYEPNTGGAIKSAADPTEIRRCLFIGNESGRLGGAVDAGDLFMEDCIFIGNKSDDGAAVSAMIVHGMDRCTLLLNEVRGGAGCALADNNGDWAAPVSHCIVARTINGWGVECGFTVKWLECCDVWGNELGEYRGNWCDNLPSHGNFSEDPLFCDPDNGDVGLLEGSPCLPGQHGGVECGVIGARGLGCIDTPVEALSWGKMRWLFR